MPNTIDVQRQQLLDWFQGIRSCAVAFSAGVDSAVVAKAAYLVLQDKAVAVTGVSPSLASGELDAARQVACLIGIRHETLQTREFQREPYVQNGPDRCFHCKQELYTLMGELSQRLSTECIVNGTNADDLGDYRPGLQAATEHRVKSPLAECGIAKADVRQIAKQWELPVWDKPATPCLSSRVAYGLQVTPERLRMIDLGEQFLRTKGIIECRVRYHEHDMARVELPAGELARLADAEFRGELVERFRSIGFRCVTLDLEGFRSGSLNALVQIQVERSSD